MRSLALFSFCALLILAVGCDSGSPDVIDHHWNHVDPLIPLGEANYWVLERERVPAGDMEVSVDSIISSPYFQHNDDWWAQLTGTSTFANACAGGYYTRRSDGYYYSSVDPRETSDFIVLKYAYPAEAGIEYVIESHSDGEHSIGQRNVHLLATDLHVDTPYGEFEAYHYRITVNSAFWGDTEYPVENVTYDRILVPGLGFIEFDMVPLQLDSDGTFQPADFNYEWTLIHAQIIYPIP